LRAERASFVSEVGVKTKAISESSSWQTPCDSQQPYHLRLAPNGRRHFRRLCLGLIFRARVPPSEPAKFYFRRAIG
jgi:hypothetical protein